jgi:hypothetical protein
MVRFSRFHGALRLALEALATLTLACTQLSDFAVHQCDRDTDCDLLEGVDRCENGRCLAGCVSNQYCGSLDPRKPICQRPGGECVPLLDEDAGCYLSSTYDEVTMGGLTARDMVVVGAFAPTFRSSLWLTIELATDEINASRAATHQDAVPPVLVALCDDGRDSAPTGVKHLSEALDARAVIAPIEDLALRSTLVNSEGDGRALFLSPSGTSSDQVDIGQNADLLWYLGPRYTDTSPTYGVVLNALVRSLEARGRPLSALRIVSLVGASSEDKTLASAVRDLVRLGGDNATVLFDQNRYRTLDLNEVSSSERANQIDQVASYTPDLVLVFAGGAFDSSGGLERASVVQALEARTSPDWRPLYLFGPRNTTDASLRRLAATSATFRARAAGISLELPLDAVLGPRVDALFQASYPDAVTPESALSVEFTAYDAMYFLVYALTARSGDPQRAAWPNEELARVTRTGAEVVNVGAADFGKAIDLLRSGSALDLNTTRGLVRFDPETHARGGIASSYCWAEDGRPRELAIVRDETLELSGAACGEETLLVGNDPTSM